MASTTLSQEILRSFDSKVEEAIPTFPEFLQTRFAQYNILQEELDILEETLSRHKIPSDQKDNYKIRIRLIKGELEGLIRVQRALHLGYEPYSMPEDWHVGYPEIKPDGWWSQTGGTISRHTNTDHWHSKIMEVFKAPMPISVLKKYEKAKKANLFDGFLVGAPDKSLFETVTTLFSEPVLVGYVATGVENVAFAHLSPAGLDVREGVGFLIEAWDLEKDRKFAGIK